MCDKKPFGRLAETSAVRHSLEGVPVDAVADVMGRLISQGLIRGWGMSQVSAETLAKAHKVTAVSAVQNLYSMLERDCEKEIFPYCLEHGIGVVPFSPIASGFLSGKVSAGTKFEGDDVRRWVPQLSKENILANQPILDVLSDCARKKGATNAQLSLAWMLPGKFLTKLEARKDLKPIIKSRLDHRPACFHPHCSAEIHKP